MAAGLYQYRDQLRALDQGQRVVVSTIWCSSGDIQTPLKVQVWQEELSGHPDRWFTDYIVRGIQQGLRIGFQGSWAQLRSYGRNMRSAGEHPEAVETYIAYEVQAAHLEWVGLTDRADRGGVHCSPFGVILKKGGGNRWRLIVDLSSPEGKSVNNGISKEISSLSVNDIMSRILEKGRGSLLGKMDIQQAYQNIPVHPEDRPLLEMERDGVVYVDMIFPFGLRSAPLLFTAVGDALQWVMVRRGAS